MATTFSYSDIIRLASMFFLSFTYSMCSLIIYYVTIPYYYICILSRSLIERVVFNLLVCKIRLFNMIEWLGYVLYYLFTLQWGKMYHLLSRPLVRYRTPEFINTSLRVHGFDTLATPHQVRIMPPVVLARNEPSWNQIHFYYARKLVQKFPLIGHYLDECLQGYRIIKRFLFPVNIMTNPIPRSERVTISNFAIAFLGCVCIPVAIITCTVYLSLPLAAIFNPQKAWHRAIVGAFLLIVVAPMVEEFMKHLTHRFLFSRQAMYVTLAFACEEYLIYAWGSSPALHCVRLAVVFMHMSCNRLHLERSPMWKPVLVHAYNNAWSVIGSYYNCDLRWFVLTSVSASVLSYYL